MVIVGEGAFARADGLAVLAAAARIATAACNGKPANWNGFNVLHTAAARVAGLDLGFVPGQGGRDIDGMLKADMDVVYLLGADEIELGRLGGAFTIYQGSHGDAGAMRADVILPGAAYTEKSVTYVNTEGRAQQTVKAAFAPGDAKEDWTIIRALSALVGQTLPYDNLSALRAEMYKAAPQLAALDSVEARAISGLSTLAGLKGGFGPEPFVNAISDFYMTNPIARASAVMAGLSALRANAACETGGGGVAHDARKSLDIHERLWLEHTDACRAVAAAAGLAARDHRIFAADGSQGVGGGAAETRPERGWSLRLAAIVRGLAEVRFQGTC